MSIVSVFFFLSIARSDFVRYCVGIETTRLRNIVVIDNYVTQVQHIHVSDLANFRHLVPTHRVVGHRRGRTCVLGWTQTTLYTVSSLAIQGCSYVTRNNTYSHTHCLSVRDLVPQLISHSDISSHVVCHRPRPAVLCCRASPSSLVLRTTRVPSRSPGLPKQPRNCTNCE